MPALAGDDDHRRSGLARSLDGQHRLLLHEAFDFLARGVQGVQLLRQSEGFGRIIGGKQPGPQVRAADAAAGVDPRSEDEARMENRGGPGL